MADRKVKVGVIGAGGIANATHLPNWRDNPGAELVAVADVNGAAAQKAGKEYGIRNVFTDFRDLVRIPEIEIVDVCTPNRVHTPAVLAALGAGKHVVCEKPLATTVAEVKQMAALAKKKKRKLMTAQHMRFTATAVAVKRWIDAGNLGRPYHARVYALRRNWLPVSPGFISSKLSGGGPCMDIGVHALDTCLWLMGFPTPVAAKGVARDIFAHKEIIPGAWGEWDRKVFDVEDWATGFVTFDNGATLVLEASWLNHQNENEEMSCKIQGTGASVRWPSGQYAGAVNRTLVDGTIQPVGGLQKPHCEELKAFHRAVVEDLPSPVPVDQTVKVIAILEAIYRSSKRGGREVAIKV